MTAGYVAGLIGFVAFKYSQSWTRLVVAGAGSGALAKGGLSATIKFKADTNIGFVDFLFSTSAIVDIALIVGGFLLLVVLFVNTYAKTTTESNAPIAA